MKTIGLIGGMSWESTAVYYRLLNHAVRQHLGGLHSARILIHSFDFDEIVSLQKSGRWDVLGDKLAEAGRNLEKAGADCLAICTNTMHKVAGNVQDAVHVPVMDIRDSIGAALHRDSISRVGLLGTQYTMEQPFYASYLERHWDVSVITPEAAPRADVHRMIFGELCQGKVMAQDRNDLLTMVDELAARGAQGIILGCTELMLLVSPDHCAQHLYDSTALHCETLAAFALGQADPLPRPLALAG